MSEVTRYVFEWRDGVASGVTRSRETRRRGETMFSRGLHLRRKGCARRERRAPKARTRKHARTHARIRDVMNVKLNDSPPRSREPGRLRFALFKRF